MSMYHHPAVPFPLKRDDMGSSQYNGRSVDVIMACRMGFAQEGACLDAPREIPAGGMFGGDCFVHDITTIRGE